MPDDPAIVRRSEESGGTRVPPVVFSSQHAARFGPRAYTPQQAEVIERTVRARRALRVSPLPLDVEGERDE